MRDSVDLPQPAIPRLAQLEISVRSALDPPKRITWSTVIDSPKVLRTRDLGGIGKAMLEDFALLKIRSVEQLAATNPVAARPLRPRHLSIRRRAGSRSPPSHGPMQLVVLEPPPKSREFIIAADTENG